MLDKLLEILLNRAARRECALQGCRPSVLEVAYSGAARIEVRAPCLRCDRLVPVDVRRPDRAELGPELPKVLHAVGGTAARVIGSGQAS